MAKTSKDFEPAIETFQKALTEHRNPDTLKKLNDAKKAKKELEQQEYFDPKIADEEREKERNRERERFMQSMAAIISARGGVFGCMFPLVVNLLLARISVAARSDKEIRERFYGNLVNSSFAADGEGGIAKMFDRVLEEFLKNDQPEDASRYFHAVLETVAKITREKGKRNDTQEANGTRSFQIQDVFSLENEDSDETTALIDKKDNVFVMSNKKSKYPVLQVDLRLISDLVVVIVSAAIGGIIL